MVVLQPMDAIRIDVISVIPGFFDSPLNNGLLSIARKKNHAEIYIHNLHDYGLGRYKQVDDCLMEVVQGWCSVLSRSLRV